MDLLIHVSINSNLITLMLHFKKYVHDYLTRNTKIWNSKKLTSESYKIYKNFERKVLEFTLLNFKRKVLEFTLENPALKKKKLTSLFQKKTI